MKKKITTMLLLSLLLLIGKTEAATLTQKIGNGYRSATIATGQQVTMKFATQAKFTFTSWTVESGNVTIDTTSPTITFTMPSSDVTIRANYTTAGGSNPTPPATTYTLTYNANGGSGAPASQTGTIVTISSTTPTRSGYTFAGWGTSSSATSASYQSGGSITLTSNTTLYAVWTPNGTILADVAEVGAYVTYIPSSTSYTVPTTASGYASDQNFNPSNTTSWRVFSNDGTDVEIISADSVGTLYLRRENGYINAVQTLNDMAQAFVNSTYAESGRSLGYYDETLYISSTDSGSTMTVSELANYKTIDTSTYPLEYNVSGFPYMDYQYIPDYTTLANHGSMYHSSGYVWLASHYGSTGDTASNFGVRFMFPSGSPNISILYWVKSDGVTNIDSDGNGVRPVITLKSNLTITGGSGTEADPYIINTSNPSQYTVTYSANGGYGEMNPQSVSRGISLTLATNAYAHHTKQFLGWSTSATATTAEYTDGQTITPTADMTLYAVWGEVEAPTYTITYNANGGSGSMESQSVTAGESVTLSYNNFSLSGSSFAGWSTNGYSVQYYGGSTITPTGDMTLYAVWNCDHLDVEYILKNNGASTLYCMEIIEKCLNCIYSNTVLKSGGHQYDSTTGECTRSYTTQDLRGYAEGFECSYVCPHDYYGTFVSFDVCKCDDCGMQRGHEWNARVDNCSAICMGCLKICTHTYATGDCTTATSCSTCNMAISNDSHYYDGSTTCVRCGK